MSYIPASGRTHETSDFSPGGLGCFAIGMLVVLVLTFLLVGAFYMALRRHYPTPGASQPVTAFPPPRLQENPTADYEAWRKQETAKLQEYGWVDRAHGVVRIPIDRAIEIIAAGEAAKEKTP